MREAEGRAAMVLEKAQARLEDIEREINELPAAAPQRRGSLKPRFQALYHASSSCATRTSRARREGPPPSARPARLARPAHPGAVRARGRAARADRISH